MVTLAVVLPTGSLDDQRNTLRSALPVVHKHVNASAVRNKSSKQAKPRTNDRIQDPDTA